MHDARPTKYVCCNADEGDRRHFWPTPHVMEGDPFMLIEGMTIAGIAVGATIGFVYIRSEYPDSIRAIKDAIRIATAGQRLGQKLQVQQSFGLEVRRGAGAYICGEENAMLDSPEGKSAAWCGPSRRSRRLRHVRQAHRHQQRAELCRRALHSGGRRPAYRIWHGPFAGSFPSSLPATQEGRACRKSFRITLGQLINDVRRRHGNGKPLRAVQVGGPLGLTCPPHN